MPLNHFEYFFTILIIEVINSTDGFMGRGRERKHHPAIKSESA